MSRRFFYLIFLFLFFLFFIFTRKVAALWYQYPNNPIVKSDINYRNPHIIYDNGVYKMFVDELKNDIFGISYLQSTNGINWEKLSDDFIITPQSSYYNESNVAEATVIKSDKYHMWFTSVNSLGYVIWHATSSDGTNWIRDSNFALKGKDSWELNGLAHPSALFLNNQYYLWYAGWGISSWQLGLATSQDGINWDKHQNNPLNLPNNYGHVAGFFVEYDNGKFIIYYHTGGSNATAIHYAISNDGIDWYCPDKEKNCLLLTAGNGLWDNRMIIGPNVIRNNSNRYLYYTGYGNIGWKIGLVTEYSLEKNPIIIIPGLFASWNKDALLHNANVNYDQWYLPSYVHEYNGLMKTLENLGYQKDKDYFIFAYDWRKPLESITEDLNAFISSKNFGQKINLVGHSLGGLVSRIYAQKFGTEKINKIITVGSPHQGAIQVYKPLAAGEIDRENTFFWLAKKLIVVLNKSSNESDREVIRKRFPIAFDLLPIFPFLKNEKEELIATDSMSIKNPTLARYNSLFPSIYSIFTAIYGKSTKSTPEFYYVKTPELSDQLSGNYQDGKPTLTVLGNGDGTVLAKSAFEVNDDSYIFENFNHGEIIYKNQGIVQILKILNIDYQPPQIVEGQGTKISPSLIFMIRSPATLEVIDENNNHYFEQDGIIFIENARSGNYQLHVKGKELGKYQVVVGQIAENNDIWEYIDGEITDSTPVNQVDKYLVNFNNQTAQPNFPTSSPSSTPTAIPTSSPTPTITSSSSSSTGTNISSSSTPTPTPVFLAMRSEGSDQTAPLSFSSADMKKTPVNQSQVLGAKSDAKKPSTSFILFPYLIPIFLSIVGYLIKKKFLSH
jgi:pimeloyl-ACP methyl ester carboxylesterase